MNNKLILAFGITILSLISYWVFFEHLAPEPDSSPEKTADASLDLAIAPTVHINEVRKVLRKSFKDFDFQTEASIQRLECDANTCLLVLNIFTSSGIAMQVSDFMASTEMQLSKNERSRSYKIGLALLELEGDHHRAEFLIRR